MNTFWSVGLTRPVTMPDDLAVAVEERPTRVARVHRGVDLDQPAGWCSSCLGTSNVRSRPDTTPALIDP